MERVQGSLGGEGVGGGDAEGSLLLFSFVLMKNYGVSVCLVMSMMKYNCGNCDEHDEELSNDL